MTKQTLQEAWKFYCEANPMSDTRVLKWKRYCEVRDNHPMGFYDTNNFNGYPIFQKFTKLPEPMPCRI